MSAKDENRVRQLVALAIGSPYSEEGRTAALEAVKRIDKLGLLSKLETSVGLAAPPSAKPDLALEREVSRLREEVARLRAAKREPSAQPSGSALLVLDAAAKAREIEMLRKEVARLRALAPAIIHLVRPGESPRGIAFEYTGDPGRVVELVGANPHKPRVLTAWGWTFTTLRANERLRLPVGWI